MQLVKYFAGSRVMGNFSWNSDLDFVRVYTQELEDIFAGVPLSTWDEYPKDAADMYEIVTFMKELLWDGNSYLYAVMKANKKESCSILWHKYEDKILDIAMTGLIMRPYNRQVWINRNLELINLNDDVIKRAFWCYYWLLQAQTFVKHGKFVLDMDTILDYNDKTCARYFWDLKREGKDVYRISMGFVVREIQSLIKEGTKIQHPLYDSIWEAEDDEGYTKNMLAHVVGRQICLEARSEGIKDWQPKKWSKGYR